MNETGRIAYSYTPEDWSQEEFLRLGGFTVVCLNYNQLKYIEKSVAAALAQDFPRLEMFFMDNASTDGSGDLLEKLVRPYRGRHKVTVVRNEVNVYITGQWNIVSKLATGNWFGMFCGDDVSLPNRVSLVADIIKGEKSLLGISTSYYARNLLTGEISGPICQLSEERRYFRGTSCGVGGPTIGATAFWHRSLFAMPLVYVPLDDILLRWLIFLHSKSTEDAVWVWVGELKTIEYGVGRGITNCDVTSENSSAHSRRLAELKSQRRFYSLLERTLRGVHEMFVSQHASETKLRVLNTELVVANCFAHGTFRRMLTLGDLFRLDKTNRRICLRRFICEFFGLKIGAFLSLLSHRQGTGTPKFE